KRLFDGPLVDLVEHGVGGLTVEGEIAVGQLALRPRVRDLFDQDHDIRHDSGSSSSKRPAVGLHTTLVATPPCYSRVTCGGMQEHHNRSGLRSGRASSVDYSSTGQYGLACVAMSASVTEPSGDDQLPLTGERTVPGLAEENYWFRRHEVVYRRLADRCIGRDVLEAGSGEGYGADLIADVARHVIGLDYDDSAVAHVRARYPRVDMRQGNLAELPLPSASIDVVVNFQVIEHLWDQGHFVAECLRVLRPGGVLLMSTPNRITFSPGRDTPVNPFHTRELNAAELTELLESAGFTIESMLGVFHGERLV